MAAVSVLCEKLRLVGCLDAGIGPIKRRDRGFSGGQMLVGMAAAQWAGEDFLVGLDRQRGDLAGQRLVPVAGLSSTTAAGLARRFTETQWAGVESGLALVAARAVSLLGPTRRAQLCREVTIDLDTTDVEVYGRGKRGVAYSYEGRRVGRPHVAIWAETETALAADLLSGLGDPRPGAADLLRRGLAALPAQARSRPVRMRADAGYFAGDLARAAAEEGVGFAIGAKRIAPLWQALAGVAESDWHEAIDMPEAGVAVSPYRPKDWPPDTVLLIRRVRLDVSQISHDPRSRRRRTLHPGQRALPLPELAELPIYGYSFILTNLDVATGRSAATVEQWYRHRTTIENVFRDAKHGAALRHLPSGHPEVNTAWMWGALIAATLAGWLHQLTAAVDPATGRMIGWGTRGGKAMLATLRHSLIRVPARLISHARQQILRLPPGHFRLAVILELLRALPA